MSTAASRATRNIRNGAALFLRRALKSAKPWLLAVVLAVIAAPAAAQTTFTNSSTILLPAPPGTGSTSNAVPGEPGGLYPSPIAVSGMGSSITKVTVTINDFRHVFPDDIDLLLVGPQGQKMLIWSDVGGLNSTCGPSFNFTICNNQTALGSTGPTIVLDDAAAADLTSVSTLVSGTFKPTNVGNATDMFPTPAPSAPYASPRPDGVATLANVFNGTNPNGTWNLYVIDDAAGATGRIAGGWSLTITTAATQQATTTTITGDTPDPSDIGQNVTVSYTVTAATGTPSGNVTVSDGVNSCVATVAAGQCTVALATAGNRTLTATYAGNASYTGSVGNAAHLVRYNTATAITAHNPDPSLPGQSVTVNYAVTPSPAGGPAPTGNVTVSDGVNSCVGTAAAGTCSLALATSGARTLTATYAGDGSNKSSISPGVTHQVKKASTTVVTSHNPAPSDIGQNVTFVFSVTGSGGTPTGNVTVGDGVNSCTATVAAGQCVVALTTPGNRTFTANYTGDSSFAPSGANGTHWVRYNTTTVIVADTPDPSGAGQPVAVSYSVTPTAAGGPAATGNVTVTDGVASCTATVAAGTCNIVLGTVGARTLTATYAGDNFNKTSASTGAAHQVTGASTTTITAVNPAPSNIGQSVTISYAVAGTAPTGNVSVSDGVNSCSATVAAGQCAVTFSTPGNRTLTATYAGDANNAGSSGNAAHVVRYNTTTVITADTPDPSAPGQSVMVSYTVAPTAAGGPAPSGNVTVSDGVASCTATAAVGTCSLVLNTAGARTLTATYAGDGFNKGSASAGAAHQVKNNSTTTILTHTPAPSDIGQNVTFTFSVTGSGGTPTGNVTVGDGVNSCTATVATGQCVVAFTTPGSRSINAAYAGDANFVGSSALGTHRVRYNTTTVITADTPDPSAPGQSVTVSYTIAPTAAGGPAPTGNVTVSDGVASCTATAAVGTCSLVLNTAGARTLTATYAGDGFNKGSASAGAAHQVKNNSTTTILMHTPAPSDIGQSVTVTYSVTGSGGTPTGNVTVGDGVNSCTGTVAAGQCVVAFTTPGNRNLTATFAGDTSFVGSAANTSHVVRFNTVTTITGHSPNPSNPGQSVPVSYIVAATAAGGPAPSGNVTVTDGVASCTGTVAAGSCNLTLNTAGTRNLSAAYAGDSFNKTSTSAGIAHQVKVSTATQITSTTPAPSAPGQPVTVAWSVTGAGGTPTGSVTVSDGVASCSAAVAAGQCALSFPTAGERTLTATYPGDANFTASQGQITHRVLFNTVTAITAHSPSPSAPGQSFTVTWTVTPTAAGGPAPTGSVTVSDGVNACMGTAAGGSCIIALTTAGTRILSANYAGDSSNKSSTSADVVHAVASPDLRIAKTHAGSFARAQIGATYTITVTNAGFVPSVGSVSVTDNLPAGLTATGIAGTGWSCAQPAGPCSRSDPLASGAGFPPLTLLVNVAADAPGTVVNTATVSGGGDGNAANNTATDPTSIGGAAPTTLTVTKWGSATGTVASQDGGINCGSNCAHAYTPGSTVLLSASPGPGSVFTGWLGACSGTGDCVVSLNADAGVTANFAHDAIGPPSLDIDDNGAYDALTDGIMITRYLFGLTGTSLVNGAIGINANRADPALVLNFLDDIEPALDIDGNGETDAHTDGLLALRYLFGMRGGMLVQGAVGAGATRSTAQIEAHLLSLMP